MCVKLYYFLNLFNEQIQNCCIREQLYSFEEIFWYSTLLLFYISVTLFYIVFYLIIFKINKYI